MTARVLSEIPRISDRILIGNRSSEISDKKMPVSDSVSHGFFLPIGNRQFPIGKNDSVRNGPKEDSFLLPRSTWAAQAIYYVSRITGPDCAVMCNLINIHTYVHTYIHAYIHTYIRQTSVDCWFGWPSQNLRESTLDCRRSPIPQCIKKKTSFFILVHRHELHQSSM